MLNIFADNQYAGQLFWMPNAHMLPISLERILNLSYSRIKILLCSLLKWQISYWQIIMHLYCGVICFHQKQKQGRPIFVCMSMIHYKCRSLNGVFLFQNNFKFIRKNKDKNIYIIYSSTHGLFIAYKGNRYMFG